MKKRYLSLLIIVLSTLCTTSLRAQMYYSFVDTTENYVADTQTVAPITTPSTWCTVTGTSDEGYTNILPFTFPFYYNNYPTPYTQLTASTNGFAALGSAITSPQPLNNLTLGGATNRPLLAPLWDNLKLKNPTPNLTMRYVVLGTAPNRVFSLEWVDAIFPTNATPTTASLSFELKLYEGYNVIDFAYVIPNGGSTYASPSASIGITAVATASPNFLSVQAPTNPTTVSSVSEQTNIASDPPSGQVYRWLPQCPNPANILANCMSYFSADLSWSTPAFPPNGPVGYEYIVDQLSTSPTVSGTPVTNPYVTATGLSPLTQYFVHVRTNCGMGNYSAWVTATFTTAPFCNPPLLYVSNVYTNVNTAGATVNWSANNITDFEYILDQTPVAPVGNGIPTQQLQKTYTGLLAATTYYFHIRSVCTPCNHSPWITVSFTTPPRCTQPLNLAINNITTNSALLSWDPVAGAIGYQYSVDQSYNPPVAGTFTASTTAIAGGLLSGAVYFLHVRTDCDSGNYSPWSTETFTTADPTCLKPNNVHETGYTQTSATFAWNVVNGNTGYEVVVNTSASVNFGDQVNSTGFPGYTASNLTPNTDYFFHVRTKCGPNHHSIWVDEPFRTDFPLNVSNAAPSNRLTVSAYPNPTGDMLTITIDGPQNPDATLALEDVNGKLITYVAIIDGKAIVDLTPLPQALYFVRYTDKYNTETIKVYKK
jgi:hypothetical protein